MRHFSDLASLVSVSCHAGPSSLLHHSPLWCLDPPSVKEHHLDLGICISIASLHGWPSFSLLWCP
jgi:hypothetical protein